MAITPSIILPSPAFIQTGEAALIGLTIANTEATAIRVSGIEVIDTNGIFVVGDNIPAVPVKYQILSGGTPVLNPVPEWGVGGATGQSDIIYWQGNVSGSTLVAVDDSGSYGGGSGSAAQPNWVEIPAGTTGYFQVSANSNIVSDLSGTALANSYVGNIQARVQVSGSSVPLLTSGTNSLYLITGKVKNVELSPIGSTNLIARNTFARNPAYLPPVWAAGTSAGFDVATQTTLVLEDNRKLDITYWNIQNDFSSSTAVVSVKQNGPYVSTPVNSALTNSVGSIYGGQTTQLSGGAGALTLDGLNGTAGSVIDTAVISNRLAAGLTGSMTIGLTNKIPVSVSIFAEQPQMIYRVATGISAQTLKTIATNNDGTTEECSVANGWTLTYSSNLGISGPFVLVPASGYCYWNGSYNGNPVVSVSAVKAGFTLTAGLVIPCIFST